MSAYDDYEPRSRRHGDDRLRYKDDRDDDRANTSKPRRSRYDDPPPYAPEPTRSSRRDPPQVSRKDRPIGNNRDGLEKLPREYRDVDMKPKSSRQSKSVPSRDDLDRADFEDRSRTKEQSLKPSRRRSNDDDGVSPGSYGRKPPGDVDRRRAKDIDDVTPRTEARRERAEAPEPDTSRRKLREKDPYDEPDPPRRKAREKKYYDDDEESPPRRDPYDAQGPMRRKHKEKDPYDDLEASSRKAKSSDRDRDRDRRRRDPAYSDESEEEIPKHRRRRNTAYDDDEEDSRPHRRRGDDKPNDRGYRSDGRDMKERKKRYDSDADDRGYRSDGRGMKKRYDDSYDSDRGPRRSERSGYKSARSDRDRDRDRDRHRYDSDRDRDDKKKKKGIHLNADNIGKYVETGQKHYKTVAPIVQSLAKMYMDSRK